MGEAVYSFNHKGKKCLFAPEEGFFFTERRQVFFTMNNKTEKVFEAKL